MESLVRSYDAVDDFVTSAWFSLRRSLARKPRERRRAPRSADKSADQQEDAPRKNED